MASFVHIADQRHAASIRRNGLKLAKQSVAIFALPVIENFVISHQWLRELKRSGFNTAVGVYFKIPDNELVFAGKYNQEKRPMTAAQAVAELRTNETMGFEVLIPRSIKATDIKYIRTLPQTLGWRYFPEAKGKPPFCGCRYCQRSNIKSKKIKARYDSANTPLESTR